MPQNSSRRAGRHFLQIPGPTPVPDRILRAMDMPVIDHRGPEFGKLGRRVLDHALTTQLTQENRDALAKFAAQLPLTPPSGG